MAHKVFICHSSKDKLVADAACAALEAQRIPCWIAPRDILAGEEYGKSIVDALASCQIVLLIFSAHANDSPQVRREIERAVSKGKIIVPFRIEDVLPSDAMEFALGNTHWLDALTPPMEHYILQLCDTISRLIQKHAVAETPLWKPQEPVAEETSVRPEPMLAPIQEQDRALTQAEISPIRNPVGKLPVAEPESISEVIPEKAKAISEAVVEDVVAEQEAIPAPVLEVPPTPVAAEPSVISPRLTPRPPVAVSRRTPAKAVKERAPAPWWRTRSAMTGAAMVVIIIIALAVYFNRTRRGNGGSSSLQTSLVETKRADTQPTGFSIPK